MIARSIAAMLLLALALVPSAPRADEWTLRDTVLEASFAATVFVDWRQTRWALGNGYEETNPLLGKHPSHTRLDLSVLGAVIGHAVVSRILPARTRTLWQSTSLFVEAGAVTHNASIGCQVRF